MVRRKKATRKKGVRSVLGKIDVNVNKLRCLEKYSKVKVTTSVDSDLLKEIKKFSEKNDVTYTSVINDVLREVFMKRRSTQRATKR